MSRRFVAAVSAIVTAASLSILGQGVASSLPAAGTAAAPATPELSTTTRLADRREVAAGHPGLLDRLRGRTVLRQRLAHHRRDGWRLDAAAEAARRRLVRARRPVGRSGDEVHERLGLHPLRPAGHRRPAASQRTDFVPDGRRGVLFGLKITNPGAARTAKLSVDAHSELMGQYPWGFTGVTPNASDNLPDTGHATTASDLAFTDDGALPGAPVHHYAALVGTSLKPDSGAIGDAVLGPAARAPLHRHRAGRAGRPQAVRLRRRPVRQAAPVAS